MMDWTMIKKLNTFNTNIDFKKINENTKNIRRNYIDREGKNTLNNNTIKDKAYLRTEKRDSRKVITKY